MEDKGDQEIFTYKKTIESNVLYVHVVLDHFISGLRVHQLLLLCCFELHAFKHLLQMFKSQASFSRQRKPIHLLLMILDVNRINLREV